MKDLCAQLNHSKPKVTFLDSYQEQKCNPGQICKDSSRELDQLSRFIFEVVNYFRGIFIFTFENSVVVDDNSDFENVSRSFWFNVLGLLNICRGSFFCKSRHDLLP